MATTVRSDEDPDLAAAVWDLAPIVEGSGDDGARALIASTRDSATAFAARWAGRLAELSPEEFVAAVTDLADIREATDQFTGYAELRAAAGGDDPSAGPLRGAAEATEAEIATQLLGFELEWLAIDHARAEAMLTASTEQLAGAAHHLRRLRARRPYLLGAAEERILAETSVPRRAAWQRLYDENVNALTVELNGETQPLNEAVGRIFSADRDERLTAMAALEPGLSTGLDTRVAAYNQILGEKAVEDRLRGHATWLSARNLSNETTDAAVDRQCGAIAARQELMRRWHRTKAQLLGLQRLSSADLAAPLPSSAGRVPFSQAREAVVSSWRTFSAPAADTIDRFFSEGRIDAPIRPHKAGGAFCAEAGATRHAYILVNYRGEPGDTMALAHELGHGLHHELARARGPLQRLASIPMLEVASTFSELLVSETLRDRAVDDRGRLEVIAACLDGAVGNVFTGSGYFAAEAAFHARWRSGGELTAEEFTELWVQSLTDAWGDTMTMDPGFRLWWSYLPHMIQSPGYMYAYPFGLLTAWSAFARYREVGPAFAEDYLAMLAAGSSVSPAELVSMIGLDLDDPAYWDAGLDLLEELIAEAEQLAASI